MNALLPGCVLLALAQLACTAALAQAGAAAARPAASAASAPNESAKRLAESPFRWIIINGSLPERKPAKTAATSKSTKEAAAAAQARDATPEPVRQDESAAAAEAAAKYESPEAAAMPASTATTATAAASAAPALAALRVLKRVLPEPPDRLISDDKEDRVAVEFVVLPDGSVAGVKVMSSTNPRLNSYVSSAVEQWRFAEIGAPRTTQTGFVFRR